MRTTVDIELNNIPYEKNVHDDIAYLQLYLQEIFDVTVEIEVDDLEYADKIALAKQIQVRQNA